MTRKKPTLRSIYSSRRRWLRSMLLLFAPPLLRLRALHVKPTCYLPFLVKYVKTHNGKRTHALLILNRRENRILASYTIPKWRPEVECCSSQGFSTTTTTQLRYSILDDLNPSQAEAVTQPLQSIVRVISGPGSGKTRVLTSRIAYLLEKGQDNNNSMSSSNRILGVTFTRKAAGEMQERLNAMVPDPEILARKVTLGTFHSICAKIMRWNGDLLPLLPSVHRDVQSFVNATKVSNNLNGNFLIIDERGQSHILKDCLDQAQISMKDSNIKPRSILSLIREYKEGLSQGIQAPFNSMGMPLSKAKQIAIKVYPLYREQMITQNQVDFDDLIIYCRELLFKYDEVRERLHRRWTHILVDEFQDTSKSQVDLVKLWTSQSLLVVGDADQSIYSWRGAHASSLSEFDTEFANWGVVQTVFLMENYRSTSNIIHAAQRVISCEPAPKQRGGATRSSTNGPGTLRRKMEPKRGEGPNPMVVEKENDEDEAQFVVESVTAARAAGNYSDQHTVALIYRTNAQSRALEEACVKANLPYVIFGSATSFYQRQEIKDCLCYLRWLVNGNDRVAMVRALTTPKRGIGEAAMRDLEDYSSSVIIHAAQRGLTWTRLDALISLVEPINESMEDKYPLDQASLIPSRSIKPLTDFAHSMKYLRLLAYDEPVEVVLQAVIDRMELIPHLDKISKSMTEFEERKQNLQELQQVTMRFTESGPCLDAPSARSVTIPIIILHGEEDKETNRRVDAAVTKDIPEHVQPDSRRTSLNQRSNFAETPEEEVSSVNAPPLIHFLDDVALVTDLADRSVDERFVVNLMTIHASKGKEFDTVFIVGNEDGTFPTSQAIQEGDGSIQLEEEKRLCYVAMTRAKTELVLTHRKIVKIFIAKEGIRQVPRKRSRFLDILQGVTSLRVRSNHKALSSTSTATSSPSSQQPKNPTSSGSFAPLHHPFTYSSQSVSEKKRRIRKQQQMVILEPEKSKLEGTTSVYAKKSLSSLALTPPITHPIKSRPGMSRVDMMKQEQQQQQRKKKIDFAWFYPVGSDVVHRQHGKGTVQPPPSHETDAMMVYVAFANGQHVKRFSAHGNDLLLSFD